MNSCREIENLVYRYAENFDLGDFEAVAEMFSKGVITHSPGVTSSRGYQGVLDMNLKYVKVYDDTGTPCTKHLVTNTIIEVHENMGSATARSHFTVLQALPDFPLQIIISGRYYDTFLKDGDRWIFEEKCIHPEFYGDLSRHLLFEAEVLSHSDSQFA